MQSLACVRDSERLAKNAAQNRFESKKFRPFRSMQSGKTAVLKSCATQSAACVNTFCSLRYFVLWSDSHASL